MAVKDYNTDPDLNTSISGINIAEGCPPSGINNAIRQLMADVKEESDAVASQAASQAAKDSAQDTAIAGVEASVAALDAAAVHKTGDETIAGAKTFTSNVVINHGNAPSLKVKNPDVEKLKTPASNEYELIDFVDKNNTRIGCIQLAQRTTGMSDFRMQIYQNGTKELALFTDMATGESYATAPTPAANSNTTHIATTAWVRAQTSGLVMPDYSAGVSIGNNANWTAPKNGFISLWASKYDNVVYIKVYDKTAKATVVETTAGTFMQGAGACQCAVVKGHVYEVVAEQGTSIFYPCIGG